MIAELCCVVLCWGHWSGSAGGLALSIINECQGLLFLLFVPFSRSLLLPGLVGTALLLLLTINQSTNQSINQTDRYNSIKQSNNQINESNAPNVECSDGHDDGVVTL